MTNENRHFLAWGSIHQHKGKLRYHVFRLYYLKGSNICFWSFIYHEKVRIQTLLSEFVGGESYGVYNNLDWLNS